MIFEIASFVGAWLVLELGYVRFFMDYVLSSFLRPLTTPQTTLSLGFQIPPYL